MTDAKDNARSWVHTIATAMNGLDLLQSIDDSTFEQEGETFDNQYTLQDRIQEMPLSVQVRGGWHNAGDTDAAREAVEYEILLTTGGPALRIIGDLGDYSNPTNARVQYQDWGTPWTDFNDTTDAQDEHIEAFAGLFYFGE